MTAVSLREGRVHSAEALRRMKIPPGNHNGCTVGSVRVRHEQLSLLGRKDSVGGFSAILLIFLSGETFRISS